MCRMNLKGGENMQKKEWKNPQLWVLGIEHTENTVQQNDSHDGTWVDVTLHIPGVGDVNTSWQMHKS